jgi:uncharacterized membrane protein YfcA
MIITEWLWALWLLVCLGVMIGSFRAYQVGARKALVMALAWICIFMIAAGIAMLFEDDGPSAPLLTPSPDADPRFT